MHFSSSSTAPPAVSVAQTDITEDGFVNLTCVARGNPVPSVTWVFNNTVLPTQFTYIIDGDASTLPATGAIVEVFAANTTGTELYTCIANNTHEAETANTEVSLFLGSGMLISCSAL